MSVSTTAIITPYALVAMLLWHRQRKECRFCKPSWSRAPALCAIILCVGTFVIFSITTRGYSDPNKAVLGWEPSKNLSVAAFLETVDVNGRREDSENGSVCDSELLLLVVVCSSPEKEALRTAIRQTWASLQDQSVRVVFLLGHPLPSHESAYVQSRISREKEMYQDIIQEDFIDSYNNLTIKSIMMLRWFTKNCERTSYLLKTDDDIFLDFRVLNQSLRRPFPKWIAPDNFLGGTLIRGASPNKDNNDKWFMPNYLYAGSKYPNYLSGTAYLMSRQVAEKLFTASFGVNMIHMEDIYITGLCARKAGVRPFSLFGFTLSKVKRMGCKSRHIMSHRVTPADMYRIWNTRAACSEFYVTSIFQDRQFGLWEKVANKLHGGR
nr:PREDICTED: beta-1,3-galactosyltransferase 1-like isoform X1 [Bemisia tabaci]XP_018910327.1 PREDICTED: beta-1,3-galactosyltransferase 1-like isoform X1 [Bemisia tabaci]XP_018910328.1 PREDICTED: beta-1,3-galactosyltransferase 1-like isoform X1 [Bemisia tabaci]XP_018910329.1 PREDICTED: beta-1,3-galactosyltransferase 1-like isoform X1 [Bemisia tabaci]XP_018910330.1 PREDICTED: beta-1,3-galactosyltransferase 1-like isoform X1 [Bemisia tabaci]XP_018910331.1 PREDICTED: beta-1,3-galactosyltransferas